MKSWAAIGALLAIAAACGLFSYEALSERPGHGAAERWEQAATAARRADRTRAEIPAIRRRDQATELFLALASSGSPAARSRAATLAGLLRIRNALADPTRRTTLIAGAAAALREGVRLDPANDDAAFDLELLLAHTPQSGPTTPPTKPHRTSRPNGSPTNRAPGTGY